MAIERSLLDRFLNVAILNKRQIGQEFQTYGNGNDIQIASQNNGADKNINFSNGFTSMGNGNKI